ncbi:MAG: hypothetical protein JKY22_00220 [Flavobacteriaceae bacterium]|nr:hypothetical protein [Flavobacteriaceae bacterium]
MRKYIIPLFVIGLLICSANFRAFAEVPHSESTQYLYDECVNALETNGFEDSYCATYIGAFVDGYAMAGLIMSSKVYSLGLQNEFKSSSDCDKKKPENLEEFVKLYIYWVDKNTVSKKVPYEDFKRVPYDVLNTDFTETLGSMFWHELTCYNTTNEPQVPDTGIKTMGIHEE